MPFAPLPFARLADEESTRQSVAFLERVRTRRSVRHFAPDPVPEGVIENAIAAASTAPSGANQQPWRFVVVRDPETKRRIREAAEKEERENYESRFPPEWLAALEPFGTDWRKEFLEIAPVLIVVFAQDYGCNDDGSKRKHYYVQESVGIAAGILLTALHWAGLATLTHTPSPMGFLRAVLNRPANERPFLLIPTGYPAPECEVPVIGKKNLDQVMVEI